MIYVLLGIVLVLVIVHMITKKKVTKKENSIIDDISNENIQVTESQDSIKLTFNNKIGYIDGRHYTEYAEDIKELKGQNKFEAAEALLLKIIEVMKDEAKAEGPHWFLAPWYFEQIAIIYRKQKLFKKEKEILEQYLNLNKIKGNGETPLEIRYRKVKKMIKKQKGLEQ